MATGEWTRRQDYSGIYVNCFTTTYTVTRLANGDYIVESTPGPGSLVKQPTTHVRDRSYVELRILNGRWTSAIDPRLRVSEGL